MTIRITVSLPDHVVAQARAAVTQGRSPSVSAYVAESMAAMSSGVSLLDLLEGWNRELGAPDADDYRWARAALGLDDGA